jgi:hypothetical protein
MSVTPNELVLYGSVKMPEADGVTVGGAVDFTKRVAFYDLSANDTIDAVSSATSDTGVKLQVTGRNVSGALTTSAVATLNGTTPITNVGTLGTIARLEYAIITNGNTASGSTFPLTNPGGTAATGDVAVYRHTPVISAHTMQTGSANTSGTTPPLAKLQSGDGASVAPGQIIICTGGTGVGQIRMIIANTGYGTDFVAVNRDWGTVPDNTTTYNVVQGMLFDISPNPVTAITRCFATAQADIPGGSNRVFYEKVFAVNNDTATDLTGANIQIASDSPSLPSGALLDLGLNDVLNDTGTSTNRQTLPTNGDSTSITFVTQPSPVSIPQSPGSLPHGAAPNASGAQGIWLRLTLPAGTTAYAGAANVQIAGSTT